MSTINAAEGAAFVRIPFKRGLPAVRNAQTTMNQGDNSVHPGTRDSCTGHKVWIVSSFKNPLTSHKINNCQWCVGVYPYVYTYRKNDVSKAKNVAKSGFRHS